MESVNGKAASEALEIAGRLTSGVESVLRGKREELKLVLAAFLPLGLLLRRRNLF